MKSFINTISNYELVKIFGGLTVITSAIVSFIAILIRDVINRKLEKRKEIEFADLKHKYSKTEAIIDNLGKSISTAYTASNQKIIDSYEGIWSCLLKIRRNIPNSYFLAYTILTKQEIIDLAKSKGDIYNQAKLVNINNILSLQSEFFSEAEMFRPFIGNTAWNIFFTYMSFIGRSMYLLDQIVNNKGKIVWYEDTIFREQILSLVIEKSKLEKLMENELYSFYNVLTYLEQAMSEEILNYLLGRKLTSETLEQSLKYSSSLAQIDKLKNLTTASTG